MANPTMKITPDAGLATIEAVRFRISQLRDQLKGNPADAKGLLKRVAALQARLPESERPIAAPAAAKAAKGAKAPAAPATLRPAVPAYLLASKSDVYEYSRTATLYGRD